ncbi:Fanconi anemia group D2 protein-like [Asterias amurensis]|uniref:Fanconi anemia group D2 protein-like n=1 Tax=Asterias amurensis TaxID=7602 RepID=UPI003AB293CD
MGKAKTKRKSASTHASPGPKRSKKNTGSKVIDKPVPTPLVDDSTFGEMVKQAGFVLMSGDFPNELSVDQAMFQLNLGKALKHSADQKQVIEEFTTGIQNHIEDPVRFKYSLLPTATATDCESARSGSQDSLMRLLLGIDEFQPSLVNVLLEKLPEFMEDQDSMFDYTEASNLPRLILNQFRWLDRVLNSQEMTDKMLEMVSVSSVSVQREIISCIPEVVSDKEHTSVATKLQELLLSSSDLTVPILDALTNLNLTYDLMIEVRNAALQTLVSAELGDHPVIIKFILQSVKKDDAVEVISELRNNLEFTSSVPERSSSSQLHSKQRGSNSKTNDSTLLILDSIKTNMRFQKVVTGGWVKAIENVPTASDHKVVDIFILLIAHTIAANRKKTVESLFRAKVRAGFFTEGLLEKAFSSHAQVLRDYFTSILSLASVLLRSPEKSVCLFACSIYRQAFLAFDMYCKQEVIGSIVAHIGSGLEGEVDAGLDVLLSLVDQNASEVAPFTIFIKGVLDYLANLSMQQIRKLFSVLAALAFRNVSDNPSIQDELHIVIRKQLSNNNPKYKRIGVIGSLMIVRNMAYRSGTDQEGKLSSDAFSGVKSLIEMVRSSSNGMPEASALFLDELATIMEERQLHPDVEEYIGDLFLNDFQDDFVVDIQADNVSGNYSLPLKEEFGLEVEESQGGVAINLLPLLSKAERAHLNLGSLVSDDSETESTQIVSPLCMAPHFRLLRICEQVQHDGDLEGIDALLGCPLYTVSNDVFSKVASLSKEEREMLCTCLFLTINWFREVVNAFSGLTDPDMRGKVLARLRNITEVQKHIQTCLEETPGFIPPMATFDSDYIQSSPSGKRGRKTKEKKKNAAVSLDDSITGHSSTQNTTLDTTQSGSPEKEPTTENGKAFPSIDLAQYRTHFRELDIEVFNILGCGQVSRRVVDSDLHTQEEVVLRLRPPELHFLLEDLSLKLDHALVAPKRFTFLKTKGNKNAGFTHLNRFSPRQIAKRAVKLLPHLCQHLESTSAFFQTLMADNDGLIDGPGSHSPEYNEMVSCLNLLLKSLLSLFSWNGFQSSESKTVFEDALTVLTARTKSSKRSQLTSKQLHKNAFTYLEKFMETLPDLPSAVLLLRLLVSLDELTDAPDNRKKLASLSEGLLKREWLGSDGQREKGAKHNEVLQRLIKIYLSHTPDTLKSIQDLCAIGIQELMSTEDKKGCSTTYPTLHRASFGSFYRVMFEHVIICIKDMCVGKASVGPRMTEQRLIRWTMAVRVFQILITMLKEFDARNNLSSALKYARQFIELFLRHGMPLLDKLFPNHRDDVMALFKTLQQSTRNLHHICGHSKVAKDVSLTNHVPAMKRILEQFVYRVKALLTMHNCHEAFWLGNLKNRDLQGEEILTQQTNDSDSEAGDDDEEELVLSDDSNSDHEEPTTPNDQEKGDNDEESYSESF